jgi:cohesin complex subunit SA-1/2
LTALYAKEEYIGSLQHFTERFKSRLTEMATSEADLSVRVAAVHVLRAIDRHGLLEDHQRDELARLIFNYEPRVRKAVGAFFAGLIEEDVQERKTELGAGKTPKKGKGRKKADSKVDKVVEEEDENLLESRLTFKALASLLHRHGHALDEQDEDSMKAEELDEADLSVEIAMTLQGAKKGRIGLAIEALWGDVEAIQNWAELAEFLLLDHSSESDGDAAESYRLTEEEESLLIEVLVVSLKVARADADAANKVTFLPVIKDQMLIFTSRTRTPRTRRQPK